MTHTSPSMPMPRPTPECAAFDALVPLLGTDALTSDEAHATQSHLETCAWCQVQRLTYDALEAAALRHYRPNDAPTTHNDMLPLQLADIVRADAGAAIPDDADEDSSDLIFEVSPITPTRPAPTNRQRRPWRPRLLAEIAAVLVVGLLAAALLVNHLGPLGGNQPPLKSAAGAVVFTHSVQWGRLQINGRTVDVTTDGHDPLYLPRGQNTLTYLAPPLPVLTCTISAPAAKSDTCKLVSVPQISGWVSSGGVIVTNPEYSGRIVDLEAVPARLSPAQREALRAAIERQFQSLLDEVDIRPGDHYATPEGRFRASDQSFKMTLHYDVAADSLRPDLQTCTPFCDVPDNLWSVAPTIHWDYIDQYGKPQTVFQGPGGYGGDTASAMNVRWDGAWQVTLTDAAGSSTLCAIVDDMILARLGNTGGGVGCDGTPFGKYGGMLMQVSNADGNTTGYALYRGGALIALDSTARTLAPWMSSASAHEMAIARQLGWKG